MKDLKMICFDMDGTIADLYGVEGWLSDLRNEIARPYVEAQPLCNMVELAQVLTEFKAIGVEIRVVTWLSMKSTEVYKREVRQAKMEWLAKQGFAYDHFHGVQYGTTKANCVRNYLADNETAILIDDSDKVREGWHLGDTINPTTENIVEALKNILSDMS